MTSERYVILQIATDIPDNMYIERTIEFSWLGINSFQLSTQFVHGRVLLWLYTNPHVFPVLV